MSNKTETLKPKPKGSVLTLQAQVLSKPGRSLPPGCYVAPMVLLDKPEPIRRRSKSR